MPVRPTYPGVYVQEVPSGVRTIVGVSTSVTAFVGSFVRGATDKAVQIFNMADFEREFGGVQKDSEASYAIQQFFANGGGEAWVIRTTNGAKTAGIGMKDAANGGSRVLIARASSEGEWGNNLWLDVDYGTTAPGKTFNLVVNEVKTSGSSTQVVRTETFRNLTIEANQPKSAVDVVEDGSKLIVLKLDGTPTKRPAQTGTVSKDLASVDPSSISATAQMSVSLDGGGALGPFDLGSTQSTHEALRSTLQVELRKLTGLGNATVELVGSQSSKLYLRIKAGTNDPGSVLTFTGALATALGLDIAAQANAQYYKLGGTAKAAQALPSAAQEEGKDGNAPTATELTGQRSSKTGIYALEDVDIFNILCIPRTSVMKDTPAASVITEAVNYCAERRAFFIVDFPNGEKTRDEPAEIKDWLDKNSTLRHKNAALYYPRVRIADPQNEYRMRPSAASGGLAGLYARTDDERGVWKAPAGTEASLRGVRAYDYTLTDQENGTLNPLAINCLRSLPVYGNVCWGARTLDGADQKASEWKYIPIRRLALFLEESLYRGLKWVVFEPNDEPLWAQIRLNVGAFMHDLFRKGAFQGQTPKEAYFVKCDSETTTQTDRDLGIVNIWVGFAPLKPAEFVILYLQQMAGQIQT